jgi:hypothetical protein
VTRRGEWAWWSVATLAAVPASAVLWFVVGQGWCGTEVYDTPRGSAGDSLCTALVKPVFPWALLASLPFFAVLVGGFIGIRLHKRGLFLFAVAAPFALTVLAVFATAALL